MYIKKDIERSKYIVIYEASDNENQTRKKNVINEFWMYITKLNSWI